MILFNFAIIFLVLHAIFYGLSLLEKQFLKNQNCYAYEVFDDQSLLWFKRIRMVNSIIGSIEIVTRGIPGVSYVTIGAIMIFIGTYLRIEAIRSLAQFWSFNVVRYNNQPIITNGIYKCFSHPSYMGNIAIVGVYLFFGAKLSTILAVVWLILFASYRILLERKHALCR